MRLRGSELGRMSESRGACRAGAGVTGKRRMMRRTREKVKEMEVSDGSEI